MATHSSILAWRIPRTVHGVAESDTTEHTHTRHIGSFLFILLPVESRSPLVLGF